VVSRELLQTYGDVELSLAGDSVFEWHANRFDLGPLSLTADTVRGDVSVCGQMTSYLLLFSQEGQSWVTQDRARAEVLPAGAGALISPGVPVTWRIASPPGASMRGLAVRIDRRFLERQFEVLTGLRPQTQLVFALSLEAAAGAGVGAGVDRLLSFLLGEIARGSALLSYPQAAIGLCEALARALLYGQRHALSHLLEPPERLERFCPKNVRLVEDYIEANLGEPIVMKDLVALTGTSSRSIQAAFRAHRGQSPMAFVKMKRLELARRRLLSPPPGSSVTSIAYGAGFPHLGQFGADYSKRFGERPSETLRRGQQLLAPVTPRASPNPPRRRG
jgi:AraC-like DNA-binding protein